MLTLSILAMLFAGCAACDETDKRRAAHALQRGPIVGAVLEIGWDVSPTARKRMIEALEVTGRGLRYLDIGAGYNTYTVVLAQDADPTDDLIAE